MSASEPPQSRPEKVTLDPRIAACPDLGDVVRVRVSNEPDLARYTGREGDVQGASLQVEMLKSQGETFAGAPARDEPAVAVVFPDAKTVVWFPSRALEFVRHKAIEMRLGDKVLHRDAAGTWRPGSPDQAVVGHVAVPSSHGLGAWIRRLLSGSRRRS